MLGVASRWELMQEFYFDTAYLTFQKEKLAELNVEALALERKRRIQGRQRKRQEHKEAADHLREHADRAGWKKPKPSVLKENADNLRERKKATERKRHSRAGSGAASAASAAEVEDGDADDPFSGAVPIDWGPDTFPQTQPSQPSQPSQVRQPAPAIPKLWSTFPMPSDLLRKRSRVAEATAENESSEEDEMNYDDLATEFAEKVHAQWLSHSEGITICDQILSDDTTWAFPSALSPDNWAFTGSLLAKNISFATLQKTSFLFVIRKSERKRGFKTLMCKASNAVSSRKKVPPKPDGYQSALVALSEKTTKCENTLWSGTTRRTATKRTVLCKVQLRMQCNSQGVWHSRIGAERCHHHMATAAAAQAVIPAAVAELVSNTHAAAVVSVTQAARICTANCGTFIPRSTIRGLLNASVDDTTWGQGGQAGLLLELMLDCNNDICVQFVQAKENRVQAMVTVARLDGAWSIVEGGLVQARKEYICMVLTVKRLQMLQRQNGLRNLEDRIAAAQIALNARLAPGSSDDIAPSMACRGDSFQVFKDSHPALIHLNAVLLSALGRSKGTHLRLNHVIWCTPMDRAHAMMHPHKIMFDTTCKTNAAKKHFGYISGNTSNHNWFKW
jgi:hypothetical protein